MSKKPGYTPDDSWGGLNGPAGPEDLRFWEPYDDTPRSSADLFKNPPKKPHYVISDFLARGKILLVYGRSASGKSMISWYLAALLAMGKGQFLGRTIAGKPLRVGVFLGENSEEEFYTVSLRQFGDELKAMTTRFHWDLADRERIPSLSTRSGIRWFWRIIARHKLDVVVVDNLTTVVGDDLTDSKIARFVMMAMKRATRRLGTTVVLLAHARKQGKNAPDDSLETLFGSFAWGALVDVAVALSTDGEGTERFARITKLRGAFDGQTYHVVMDPKSLVPTFVPVDSLGLTGEEQGGDQT